MADANANTNMIKIPLSLYELRYYKFCLRDAQKIKIKDEKKRVILVENNVMYERFFEFHRLPSFRPHQFLCDASEVERFKAEQHLIERFYGIKNKGEMNCVMCQRSANRSSVDSIAKCEHVVCYHCSSVMVIRPKLIRVG